MKYDAIIIGSGQAGNPLAYRLADVGWQVALIEKGNVGGTCINTGCTPTKTMVHRAQIAHYARNASRWGVRAENVTADLPIIVAQKDNVVASFRGAFPGIDKGSRVALLMRVGNAPPPTARVGRLPLADSIAAPGR